MKNYFEVLNVSENAEVEVIRLAYKALAKKYHPDSTKLSKEFAEAQMRLINEAYEVLMDDEKRRRHKMELQEERKKSQQKKENEASGTQKETAQERPDPSNEIKKTTDTKRIIGEMCVAAVVLVIFIAKMLSNRNYAQSEYAELQEQMSGYSSDVDTKEETGDSKVNSYEYEDTETVESDFILPESSSRYLTTSDLYGLSAEECRIARNEIYARHGRMFNDEGLQAYFNSFDWYYPTIRAEDFTESMLNAYEIENTERIVKYEKEQGYR